MDDRRNHLGNFGENAAEGYLATKGYAILARGFKAARGEIDIIAKDGEYIVFVEVKLRRQLNFGAPALAVTKAKQKAISDAAGMFLAKNDLLSANCRFDVIEIFGRENYEINHIKDAFWGIS